MPLPLTSHRFAPAARAGVVRASHARMYDGPRAAARTPAVTARRSKQLLFLIAAALLAACSGKDAAPPAQAPAAAPQNADRAQAKKSTEMYLELVQSKSYELAAPIGEEIVQKYPGSAEAGEVQATLADTVARAKSLSARRRLERLWIYQTGKESGGEQSTASIYSSEPASADRVRLILRRHSAWGQSVYLFGSGKGFECKAPCTVSIRFDDGPPQHTKAHLPETGEPAIFISDDRAFIAKMVRASKVSIDVVPKGHAPQTLLFEVGGYDPEKFATPPKH